MGTFIISYPNCGKENEILQKGGIFAKGARITPLSHIYIYIYIYIYRTETQDKRVLLTPAVYPR